MTSFLQRIRRISNPFKPQRQQPKTPTSVADFPGSVEFEYAVPQLATYDDEHTPLEKTEFALPENFDLDLAPPVDQAIENPAPDQATRANNDETSPAPSENAGPSPAPRYVSISKGKNKGKEGEITGMYDKRTYRVRLSNNVIVNVRIASTDPISNEGCSGTTGDCTFVTGNSENSQPNMWVGLRVQDASGRKGIVEGAVDNETVSLRLDNGNLMQVTATGLSLANEGNFIEEDTDKENVMSKQTKELVHQKGRICAGAHRSKIAEVVRDGARQDLVCVKRTSIEVDISKTIEPTKRRPLLQQVAKSRVSRRKSPRAAVVREQASAWSMPDTQGKTMTFGGFRVTSLRLDDNPSSEITMLDNLFGERLMKVQLTLNNRSDQKALPSTIYDGSFKYELIAVKVSDDTDGGPYSKKRILNAGYVRTEGPDLTPLDLQNELLRIADFSRIPTRKIVARLELFLSPARFSVYFAKDEDFGGIPEIGNVGCGFISEEMLLEICSQGKISKAAASRAVAIQVRIFCPAKGIFKGVLVRKRATAKPIELPPSMQKVPPSTHENPWNSAAIVVCKNGLHPSPGSANEYIGRALDESLNAPPTKSFEEKIKKKLSDMVLRLWENMGVPRKLCAEYVKESLHADRRNHAWIVGVADPTGCLPPDTVFVPGMKTIRRETLFVTRSPCVKYDDGRLLNHVVEQPSGMTNQDWEWLNNLSFGCIVFSNPKDGMMSMPERIAVGDLDGDLYLVCWDEDILSAMNAADLPPRDVEDDGRLSTIDCDGDWLEHAQQLMQDVGSLNDMRKLCGKLYTLGEKQAKSSLQGLRDPAVAAFFDAYNQALEFKKHGRPIFLPLDLHAKVPMQLRPFLTDKNAQ